MNVLSLKLLLFGIMNCAIAAEPTQLFNQVNLGEMSQNGKASLEYRYYISSAALTKARFANAVRSHWTVENSLHWVLDVSMKEDQCQIYRGNAAGGLSGARKMALNMLWAETTRQVSIPRKQKRAHGSTDYLEQVLTAGLAALSKN